MAKKNEHYAEAERLYVQEHLGQADIAERLGVSERTVRYWAQEGNWAERRGNFAEATSNTHEKMFKLLQVLTDKVIKCAENDEEISQSQLYVIAKMAPLLLKLQKYEEEVKEKSEPVESKPKGLTEETIRKIESEILGIKR